MAHFTRLAYIQRFECVVPENKVNGKSEGGEGGGGNLKPITTTWLRDSNQTKNCGRGIYGFFLQLYNKIKFI